MKTLNTLTIVTLLSAAMTAPAMAQKIDTNGRLQVSSDDGSFSVRLRARIHADVNLYDSDNESLTSGAYIRRARIGVQGNIQEWGYEVTFDNAGDSTDLKDAKFTRSLAGGTLQIGQFKSFEGFEQLTSSNDITFIERSHVGNTVAGRQIGVGYNNATSMFGWGGTVYNLREAADGGTRATTDGIGAVGRFYLAPMNDQNGSVHIGASYAFEKTDIDGERGRVRPAGRANDYTDGSGFRFNLYDRRGERAEITRLNLEAAAVFGAFSAQAEYMIGNVETNSRPDDEFTVWYAQASYMLTGEARRYDVNRGRMRNPRLQGGAGAWEMSVRYQYAERDIVNDAELTTVDFGLTYYANSNMRFMLNYSLVDNQLLDDEPSLLSMRAQWAF